MFDDSLLGTAGDESEHLKLIDRFLSNCVAHGTVLKPTKTKLCRSEVVHQGYVIGHGYYYKDPEAVRPLIEMRLSGSASELKSQMSMLGRYRNFVPEYSQLAVPLEDIMHDRWRAGTFTPKHEEALIDLWRQIAQETMLTMPDWNRPFHWRIDAQPTFGCGGPNGRRWKFLADSLHVEESQRRGYQAVADGDGGHGMVLLPLRQGTHVFAVQPE